MSMSDFDILVIKKMLKILNDLGPAGIESKDLCEQAQIACSTPITTTEMDIAVTSMKNQGWISSYRQPMTGRIRWYLNEQGKIAYAGL
jgi:DNA-binding MarR family transcriptional regulator